MKKAARRILRIGAVIASLLILIIFAALLIVRFNKPLIRNIVQSQLSKRTGAAVRIGKLDYTLFPFHLTAQNLAIGLEDRLQKVDLSLAAFEAKGDIRKIIRGEMPALETIAAEGAAIRFTQKAPPEKAVDYEAIVLRTAQNLAWAKKITVKNTRLSVKLASFEANLGDFNLDVTPGDEKSGLTFSIGRSEVEIKDKAGASSLRSGLGAWGTLHLAPSLGFDVRLALDSPTIAAGGIEESPAGVSLESSGTIALAAKEFTIPRLKLIVPNLIEVEGKAGGKFARGFSFEGEGAARLKNLESVTSFIRPWLPDEIGQTRVRGQAVLSGKYGMQRSDKGTTDNMDGSLTFAGVELALPFKGFPLHVRASGKINALGPSTAPRLTADVRSTSSELSVDKFRFGKTAVHIAARAAKNRVHISRLDAELGDIVFSGFEGRRVSLDAARLQGEGELDISPGSAAPDSLEVRFGAEVRGLLLDIAGGKSLSLDTITLKGQAGLNAGRKTLTLGSLEARIPGISPLFLSGNIRRGKTPEAEIRLETRGLDLPALGALTAAVIPERLAGWDLSGAADLSLEARRPSATGKDWGFSGSLAFARVKFNDPDFTIAGEGINPTLTVDGDYSPSEGLSFKGGLDISQGESLWKAVFIPWNAHPLKVRGSGLYNPKSGGMTGLSARFEMPTIGEIRLSGSAQTHPSPSVDLNSNARLSLGPLYSLYTQAGVSEESRMSLTGTLEAGLHIKNKGDDLAVAGKVALADTTIERPDTGTAFLDIDAELPVIYESGEVAAESPAGPFPENGFVNIGEFRNPLLSLKSLAVPLRAGTNAFSIEPLTQEIYGGRVELGRTIFRFDPQSRGLQGLGSLAVRGLDISLLPIPSPKLRLTGKLEADFPRLDISPEEISLSGRGEASVFGGKVVLRDLAVSKPFTPGRSISLNIDLIDLNLKKLTDEVPFGEVTGIVRGEVRNLVISYGQPERFDFRVESVPRKGIPQTFSLKAVDNLTVISTGEPASLGTGKFWMRFIRGFRYKKLGIVSTLRNDTFTLNGTIREGGLEYLVKKPALFGINVINRMPEKLISFKEMTSRLKRVGQSEK